MVVVDELDVVEVDTTVVVVDEEVVDVLGAVVVVVDELSVVEVDAIVVVVDEEVVDETCVVVVVVVAGDIVVGVVPAHFPFIQDRV